MASRRKRASILLRLATAAAVSAAAIATGYVVTAEHVFSTAVPPTPRAVPAYDAVADTRPLLVTVTRDWKKIQLQCSADEVIASPSIWMDMHFADWDHLPADIRRRGLLRLRHRFANALAGAPAWSLMRTVDWDAMPQPVRMAVFPLMIEHWVRQYGLGSALGVPLPLVSDTVSAIVMAESWFQHRADVVNEWGNRDIGLGQCSDRCRRELARLAETGSIGFTLNDEDYFNPWHATRAAVVWFGLELVRAEGDVDLAIRAYHRGFEAASRGEGVEYLQNVRRLRGKYFESAAGHSPTWRRLAAWARSAAKDDLAAPFPVAIAAASNIEQPAPAGDAGANGRQLASSAAPASETPAGAESSHARPARGRTR